MLNKKLTTNNKLSRSIFTFSLLGIGIIIGLALKSNFTLSREINPVELLSIFCTFFLAWYVAHVIDKNRSADKGAKDLFVSRISSVVGLVDEFFLGINSSEMKLQDAVLFNKRIRTNINSIYLLSEKVSISLDLNKKEILMKELTELNKKTTYTQPRNKNISTNKLNVDLEVKSNILYMSETNKSNVSNTLISIKDNLFIVQIEIYSK